ncbi:hypothetical protein B0H66DRAFT_357265 [Apodospora peruviana]|uniref:Fungal N-terminal domain-containing protein n=1 Tax=Apodospora peruviana TaxID=516989 RepID=A0AAE0M0G3_9PEZI|nr:hypothetical protein B0H66DRAFT_357265 [Apodospora peruviana]
MDPISLSLRIGGIPPLVATILRHAKKYHDDVRGARESIALLITELNLLETALSGLQPFLSDGSRSSNSNEQLAGLQLDQSSALLTCSAACLAKLDILARKLHIGQEAATGDGRRARVRHLFWPLSESEHKKTMQELRDFTLWIQFSLSVGGIRLLSQFSESMMQVMRQQFDQLDMLRSVGETTSQVHAAVQDQARIMESKREAEEREKSSTGFPRPSAT